MIVEVFEAENGLKLNLSDKAMDHIIKGDLSLRPEVKDGFKVIQPILSGGMHTIKGWLNLKSKNNGLVNILNYDHRIHQGWYYARELQNGTIVLRLPKSFYSGKAANITKYPDNYYKSGYLWKTLFPADFDEKKVKETISEALNNIDTEASSEGQIVGYSNFSDPLKTLRVTIQYHGNEIKSAFPSWGQPNTGNNGKAYSHFDNIGFAITASSCNFDDVRDNKESEMSIVYKDFNKIVDITPNVFKERDIVKINAKKYNSNRLKNLLKYAEKINENELIEIKSYLSILEIHKDYLNITKNAYYHMAKKIQSDKFFFNSIHVLENVVDGMRILAFYDLKNSTKYFYEYLETLLHNLVIHDFTDSFLKKRLYSCMLDLVMLLNNKELNEMFINLFCVAPSRREFMREISRDTLLRKRIKLPAHKITSELMIIINPDLNFDIKFIDFIEFVKEAIGETYSIHKQFDDEFRSKIIFEQYSGVNYPLKKMMDDSLKFMSCDDLNYFSIKFVNFIKNVDFDYSNIKDSIKILIRDYCRLQFSHRMRLNLVYKEFWGFEPGEMYLPIDRNLLYTQILKHERIINIQLLENLLDGIADLNDDEDVEELINSFREKIGKEIPPIIDVIPEYILKRYSRKI
ncbi:hypothetical protein [Acinetobacter sp. NIPH 2100]|uniref:hypothetical protein n=1 Tax=Acinetobacter sp. NIPH 2100 TaxID=1217708 RepID=UPI0002CEA4BE|nr:hypothetical protein [Acinetobacter sp. NIPH 2100]ENX41509.1 hypothetical protein F887_01905 [Acinetobacter sp. NIPH 2100]